MKICFSNGSDFQLERLVSYHHRHKEEVALYIPDIQLEYARSLKSTFPSIHSIEVYRKTDGAMDTFLELDSVFSESAGNEVFISYNEKDLVLRQMDNIKIPDLISQYGLCSYLSRYDVGTFNFFNSNQIIECRFPYFLNKLRNRHKTKRCFILGNGPSLNQVDMPQLKNEITFGCNRGYLGYEKWGFPTDYWTVGDKLQVERHMWEWESSIPDDTIKFIPMDYCGILNLKNLCPINFSYDYDRFPLFSNDPDIIYLGHTTVYYLMQLAVIMGFTEIVLVGVDNKYTISKEDKEKGRWTNKNSINHFDPRYCENGKRKFVIPKLERANIAFEYAAKWCESNNIKVLNASPGSALTVFERVEFDALF